MSLVKQTFLYGVCLLVVILSSCLQEKTHKAQMPDQKKVTKIAYIDKLLLLSAHAQSIAPPSDYQYLFEADSIVWFAYPDELLAMQFDDSIYISHLFIEQASDSTANRLLTVVLYVNNCFFGLFPSQESITINKKIRQLAVRPVDLVDMPLFSSQAFTQGKPYQTILSENLSPAAIQSLNIYDENKQPYTINAKKLVATNRPNEPSDSLLLSISNRLLTTFYSEDAEDVRQRSIYFYTNGQYWMVEHLNDQAKDDVLTLGSWQLAKSSARGSYIQLDARQAQGFLPVKKHSHLLTDRLQLKSSGQLRADSIFSEFYTSPHPATLIDIQLLTGDILLDMRYATNNNFVKEKLYDCPRCLLRYEVAEVLLALNRRFMQDGYQIKVFDCYRPFSVQERLWEIYPHPGYVADPNKSGSVHNRGGAIDMTIVDKHTGKELDMGTEFDYFGREASPEYLNLPDTVLANRQYLHRMVKSVGFRAIRSEWWHFSHPKAFRYPISNQPINCD